VSVSDNFHLYRAWLFVIEIKLFISKKQNQRKKKQTLSSVLSLLLFLGSVYMFEVKWRVHQYHLRTLLLSLSLSFQTTQRRSNQIRSLTKLCNLYSSLPPESSSASPCKERENWFGFVLLFFWSPCCNCFSLFKSNEGEMEKVLNSPLYVQERWDLDVAFVLEVDDVFEYADGPLLDVSIVECFSITKREREREKQTKHPHFAKTIHHI
jgi:hypothetical protein